MTFNTENPIHYQADTIAKLHIAAINRATREGITTGTYTSRNLESRGFPGTINLDNPLLQAAYATNEAWETTDTRGEERRALRDTATAAREAYAITLI